MSEPWWNILLYTNGGKPFKYVVKKIDGVWFVRFGESEHEEDVRRCKQWMKKDGYVVRSFPKPTICCCKKNNQGQPMCKPTYHNHRSLWTDRMRTGTYGGGGIKMVSDLIEKGEWV